MPKSGSIWLVLCAVHWGKVTTLAVLLLLVLDSAVHVHQPEWKQLKGVWIEALI